MVMSVIKDLTSLMKLSNKGPTVYGPSWLSSFMNDVKIVNID